MNKFITKKFYNPFIYFFLLTFLSLLFGSLSAAQFSQLNYLVLTLFYVYIFINQLIENILLRIPQQDFLLSKKILFILEFFNLSIILFFSWSYSFTAGVVLLFYTLIIQLQFLFSYYDLEIIASIISSLLKVILLNSFAFYIQTKFITYPSALYSLGIFLPYLSYELIRLSNIKTSKVINIINMLAYPIATFIMWSRISYFSLFLFLSLPFILITSQENIQKKVASSLIMFSILYTSSIIFSFVL